MKLSNTNILSLVTGFWLLVTQCAQIVPPSGGKADETAPQAVKYIPDSAAKNFSGKNIAIVFDEYVLVSDLQKQLIISPPMSVQPEVKVKGRLLTIEIKDSLRKNTTYTMNFGSAIRDFTEGNVREGFQYIFSTGPFIDSLKVTGTVMNALDSKTEKGILVMLYEGADDSLPYKKIPSYFAKTNGSGGFTINNIRKGTYKAFALKDINANYLYDSPDELIGFPDGLIDISKNISLDIKIFKEDPPVQKLKKAFFAEHGHIVFSFAKPVKDSVRLDFLSEKPKNNVIYEYSKERDTLHYWFSDDLKDTVKIKVLEAGKIIDTVRLRPITMEQTKTLGGRGSKWGLVVRTNVQKDKLIDLHKSFVLEFSHPVYFWDFQGFSIREDSSILKEQSFVKNTFEIPFLKFHTERGKRKFTFTKSLDAHAGDTMIYNGELRPFSTKLVFLKENTPMELFVPAGSFTDIFGLKNDTIKINFKTQEEKFYGTFRLTLKLKSNPKYILQLIGEKGEIFEPVSADKGIFFYNYLPPGPCKLRIIYDANGDGKWTTGNYLQKRKPETVVYYSGDVTIRSNWDLELEWKVE